eukprot:613958-Alexandrium_andersonii.AAC.1
MPSATVGRPAGCRRPAPRRPRAWRVPDDRPAGADGRRWGSQCGGSGLSRRTNRGRRGSWEAWLPCPKR